MKYLIALAAFLLYAWAEAVDDGSAARREAVDVMDPDRYTSLPEVLL